MTDQIREARERLLKVANAYDISVAYSEFTGERANVRYIDDAFKLAIAYLDITKGEWLEAADSEGWWWHDGVTAPGSVDLVHVFYCEIARCLSYRTPGEIKCPASGGKWQKVIGPFNTKKE